MDVPGGVPEPLLPPGIALQNPELAGGHLFFVVPELERIVVMIDRDGDENYEPCVVPLDGGFPEALAPEAIRDLVTRAVPAEILAPWLSLALLADGSYRSSRYGGYDMSAPARLTSLRRSDPASSAGTPGAPSPSATPPR